MNDREVICEELMLDYDPSYSDFMHGLAEKHCNIYGPYPDWYLYKQY